MPGALSLPRLGASVPRKIVPGRLGAANAAITRFLLDAKGIIRFKFDGFQEGPEMTQAIEALLAEAAPATPDAPPTSEPADEPAPTP